MKFHKRRNRSRKFWSEPFRPFFLLGWMIGLIGLAMWPLFFVGAIETFPGRAHAFLMIEGFFAAFAVGFLWTALPRMLEVPGPGTRWIAGGLALIGSAALCHLAGLHLWGHALFLALLGIVAAFAALRFRARRDLPPPSFVLVAGGLATGVAGVLLVAAGEAGSMGGFFYAVGRIFLAETFLLFLVMGVAAFLAPRFLGQPSKQSLPGQRRPSRAWAKQAALAAGAGIVVMAGALTQAGGAVRIGSLATALPVTFYILHQVPLYKKIPQASWMAQGLRVALLCGMAAPWLRVAMPDARLAAAHLLLMGFGLLTLVVGARVILGHSGFGHLFQTRMPWLGGVFGLYALALGARLAAEFVTDVWIPLAMASAVLLLSAHALWGWIVLPKLFRPKREVDVAPPATRPGGAGDRQFLRNFGQSTRGDSRGSVA